MLFLPRTDSPSTPRRRSSTTNLAQVGLAPRKPSLSQQGSLTNLKQQVQPGLRSHSPMAAAAAKAAGGVQAARAGSPAGLSQR